MQQTYAPDIYQDSIFLDKNRKVLSPASVPVDPFFDGDEDFTNNAENILKQVEDEYGFVRHQYDLKSRIPVGIFETDSHYYLYYIIYHARDDHAIRPQAHDSESVLIGIKKSEEIGDRKIEFLITNSNSFPRIYSEDVRSEAKMREELREHLNLKNKLAMELLFGSGINDKALGIPSAMFARLHHTAETSFSPRPSVFVVALGNALYKADQNEWKKGSGEGYIYTCVNEGEEGSVHCFPIRQRDERIVGYSLRDFDELMAELYPRNLPDEKLQAVEARRSKMFEGVQKDFEIEVTDGKIRLRKDYPRNFAKAPLDQKAEANLPTDWSLKINIPWAFPHLVHRFLQPENKDISDHYIFNPAVEYADLKSKELSVLDFKSPIPQCPR